MKIESTYSPGDKVYYATTRDESYNEPCSGGCVEGRLRIEGRPMTVACPDCSGRGYYRRAKAAPRAQLLTIGQVRVEITDSPGCDDHWGGVYSQSGNGETNYSPKKARKEEYMCIETGIGSGSLYPVGDLFQTEADALARAAIKLQEWEQRETEEAEYREKQRQHLADKYEAEEA